MTTRTARVAMLVATLALAACDDAPSGPAPVATHAAISSLKTWLRAQLDRPWSPSGDAAMLVGAGDIAECYDGPLPTLQSVADARRSAAELNRLWRAFGRRCLRELSLLHRCLP